MSSLCQHVAPEVTERISSDVVTVTVTVIVIAEICEIDKLVYYDFQPLL